MSQKLYDSFNKEEILDLYLKQRLPLSKIAEQFKVSHKTMKKFFVKNNITVLGRISSNRFLADKIWLEDQYTKKNRSIQSIATMVGSTRGNVHSALRYAGIPIRGISEGIKVAQPDRFGANASNYRGGRRITGANGRYYQILDRSHPDASTDGYVLEQRYVMGKHLGRSLTKDEIVHHIDSNGHNNSIENLRLTTRKKHFKDHFDGVKEVNRLQKLLTDNGIKY